MKTTATIDASFFVENRKKLKAAFPGTAPIVLAGNGLIQKSADSAFPFRQDSSFWYMTGVDHAGFTYVLESDKEYLIAPKQDAVREIFDGAINHEEISRISGIEEIVGYEEGFRRLERRIKKTKHAAVLLAPAEYIDQMSMYTSPARRILENRLKEYNPDLSLIDLRPAIARLRAVKSEAEIAQLETAVAYTKELYKILEKSCKKYSNERELLAEVSREVVNKNIDFAYEPIIAGGKNALTLHYIKNDSPIDKRKFLLVDLAARAGFYNADITRTVVEVPSKRQSAVYGAVLAVQEHAISLLKPGISLADYEEQVHLFIGEKLRELGLIKTISKESVRRFYPHATSHFLGIDVHDVGDHREPLKEGMVLTVEPGIYIEEEGIGVRIEDMIRITGGGRENLSLSIPKFIDKFF